MKKVDVSDCSEMIMSVFQEIEKSTLERSNNFYKSWKKIITSIKSYNDNEISLGQNLYEHSKVIEVKNGIMLIETDHPGWTQMMQMNKRFILKGLKMYMPEMNVTTLLFRVKGSDATLSDLSYDKQLEEANKKELEKINRKQTILKKYEKVDDNNKNESHSSELPEDISNMFKGMMKTMLTKNQNK